MEENLCQKAYEWAYNYSFEEIEIDYAARLALKMLDNSCNMSNEERKVFFYVHDALMDREDLELEDDVNKLIKLARNRATIYSKPEFAPIVHAAKMEVMQSTQKKYMKRFKKLIRQNLGMAEGSEE